jgi:hypothetical protein
MSNQQSFRNLCACRLNGISIKGLRAAVLLLVATSYGCQGVRLVREGEATRNAILDLYTEQAMDNLVRARCNMPFVQLAYRDIGVQDLDTLGASINDTYGDTNEVTRTGLAIVTSAVHTVSNSLMIGASQSRSKTLSYSAQPVTDQNDIYLDYLAFANDPGLLMESCVEPKCYHVRRKCNGKWYWVPPEAGPVFLALVLKTSMMRGPELLPQPFYTRKIVDVHPLAEASEKREVSIIEFDKTIPFGDAMMDIKLDSTRDRLQLRSFGKQEISVDEKKFDAVAEGTPSNYFKLTIPATNKYRAKDLVGITVQVFSDKYPPKENGPSPEMQRLEDNVNSLDVNLKNLLVTPR